jgi:segregation and condensation protein A
MGYKLRLEMFEGPLDLLLFLIKKNDIDIYDIPITEITEQYMEYIDTMQTLDLNMVGDFLVMAATLMHIKSKMLLPPDPLAQEEEELDPRNELVRRLEEYKKFKEIAEQLKNKEGHRQDLFGRLIDEQAMNDLREDAKEVMIEATLFDLINALSQALRKVPEKATYEVTKEEFTVEHKIHAILHILIEQESINLMGLFAKAQDKMEVIVTFMAVLELIRLREIVCVQKRAFEDIEIVRNKSNLVPESQQQEGEQEQSSQQIQQEPAPEPNQGSTQESIQEPTQEPDQQEPNQNP